MRRTASDKKKKALTCAKDCAQVVGFVSGLCLFIFIISVLFIFKYVWRSVNDEHS
jgi:hypothetical protein